jgi:hypothetical protein
MKPANAGTWKLETGKRKLELENENWKLETGKRKLELENENWKTET